MFFSTFCPMHISAEFTFFANKKKPSVLLRDANPPPKTWEWQAFIDSNTVNSMVWETRTSLAAWFQECQCQLYLVKLHVELGPFSPRKLLSGGISCLKLPASRLPSRANFATALNAQGADEQMVTPSRVPNLLPPRPSQDDGTLAKANSLK